MSLDGKWIATVSFAVPMQIEVIKADDFSVMRNLGNDDGGQLQWSPDSRYLLLWTKDGSCGLGSAYSGPFRQWISEPSNGDLLRVEGVR